MIIEHSLELPEIFFYLLNIFLVDLACAVGDCGDLIDIHAYLMKFIISLLDVGMIRLDYAAIDRHGTEISSHIFDAAFPHPVPDFLFFKICNAEKDHVSPGTICVCVVHSISSKKGFGGIAPKGVIWPKGYLLAMLAHFV